MASRYAHIISCLALGLVILHNQGSSALFLPLRVPFMPFGPHLGFATPFFPRYNFPRPNTPQTKPASRPFTLADAQLQATGPIRLAGGLLVDADVVNGDLVYRNNYYQGANDVMMQGSNNLLRYVEDPNVFNVVAPAPQGQLMLVNTLSAGSGINFASQGIEDSTVTLGNPGLGLTGTGPTSGPAVTGFASGPIEDSQIVISNAGTASGMTSSGSGVNALVNGEISDSNLIIGNTGGLNSQVQFV